MTTAYDRTLAAWGKTFDLSPEIRTLIRQANDDLYDGPWGDVGYPGFSTACRIIREALEDVPSSIYIDANSEMWQEEEPEPVKCEACDGQGTITIGHGDDAFDTMCDECKGAGCFGAYEFSEWWKVERAELIEALVGKELAPYVR